MARNGSGTYSLPEAAFVYDTVISETAMNSNNADIATALTDSIAANGETPITANLPMATYKHTGVGAGTARAEYADAGSVGDGDYLWCGVAGGSADAITLTGPVTFTALVTGMKLRWKASGNSNTGAATVDLDSIGTVALEINDSALSAGNHEANKYYEGLYDGTAFQIQKISGVIGDLLASLNLSDVGTAATAFDNIKQAATAAATGVVEIATQAEVNTGADTARSITPATLDGFVTGKSDVTITATDEIVYADVTDSNKAKKDTVQGILDLLGTFSTANTNATPAQTLNGAITGADNTVSAINLKDYGEVTNAIGSIGGGAQTIDLTLGNSVSATVDTSETTFTFSNPTASDELCGFTLILINGGSQTVNWPGSVDWEGATAPTLTASGTDVLVFITIDGGTIWHGMIASSDSSS